MRIILLAIFLFAVPGLSAQATDALPVKEGDEVRLHGPLRRDPLTLAVVQEFGPSYLRFTVDDYPGVVFVRSYKNLDAIDVKTYSRRESVIDAATWGMYVGAGAGAIAGPFLANVFNLDTGPSIGVVGTGAGLIGGLVGAAAGAFLSPLRWRRYVLN